MDRPGEFRESSPASPDDVLWSSTRTDLSVSRRTLGPHGGHQSADAQNLHHALHVVGQQLQRHFAGHFRQPPHLKVRGSHPRLDGPERVLHGLAAHSHFLRVAVEPVLHSLKNGLVLPPRYPALLARRALSLQGARLTCCGPVAAQHLASFLGREPIGQPLAGRTAIDIVGRNVDEVLLAETARRQGARSHRLR